MNCYFMRKCTGDKEQKHFGLLKGINTKLIPTSALMRKKINHISSLRTETGEVGCDGPWSYVICSQEVLWTSVCKLTRSIYGLRQASRQRNYELSKFLISMGYTQSVQDYSLFVKTTGTPFTSIVFDVDDLLLTRNDLSQFWY